MGKVYKLDGTEIKVSGPDWPEWDLFARLPAPPRMAETDSRPNNKGMDQSPVKLTEESNEGFRFRSTEEYTMLQIRSQQERMEHNKKVAKQLKLKGKSG